MLAAMIGGAFVIIAARASRPDPQPDKPENAAPVAAASVIDKGLPTRRTPPPAPVAPVASVLNLRQTLTYPQPVNEKSSDSSADFPGAELATHQFEITSVSEDACTITRGEFIPADVQEIKLDRGDDRPVESINHENHIKVLLDYPQPKVPVPFQFHRLVAPNSKTKFVLWFKSDTSPKVGVLVVSGRVKLYCDDGASVQSGVVSNFIHSDTKHVSWDPSRKLTASAGPRASEQTSPSPPRRRDPPAVQPIPVLSVPPDFESRTLEAGSNKPTLDLKDE